MNDEQNPEEQAFDAVAAAAELTEAMEAADGSPGDSSGYVEILEGEVAELNALLATKEAATQAALKRADAAQEEISQARERLAKEASQQGERRLQKILVGFLDVLDDLDRALEAAQTADHTNPEVISGIELVRRRFFTTLEGFSVARVESLGQPFDPALHDAISSATVEEDAAVGQVITVVREGYTIDGELLRPASVVVGKK